MLELRRATLPLSGTSLAPWVGCAALVLSVGIACSSTVLDGSSSSADVAGTWTLSPVVPDLPCPPQRDGFAIDQVGQDLVFMFDPTGFARATISGRSVLFDYVFETPSDDQRFRGSLDLSADGSTLTGAITFERGFACIEPEQWTATRVSSSLPPRSEDLNGLWDTSILQDPACISGEGPGTLVVVHDLSDDSVTIGGFFSGLTLSGFVTRDFIRAQGQVFNGGATVITDAVVQVQDLFGISPTAFGDLAFELRQGVGQCTGNDGYDGPFTHTP